MPELGDIRVSQWFAWLPVNINGEKRWLERVVVVQEWSRFPNFAQGPVTASPTWKNRRFIDNCEDY